MNRHHILLAAVLVALGSAVSVTLGGPRVISPASDEELSAAVGGEPCVKCNCGNVDCNSSICVPEIGPFDAVIGSIYTKNCFCEPVAAGYQQCQTYPHTCKTIIHYNRFCLIEVAPRDEVIVSGCGATGFCTGGPT